MAKAELFQKDLPEEERVFYYDNEEDDPIKTKEQERKEKEQLAEEAKELENEGVVAEKSVCPDVFSDTIQVF